VAYLLASWLPTAARAAGHATAAAVLVGTAVQAGGMVGTFALGPVLQRRGFGPLAGCFAVAALALCLVGDPGLPLAALVAVAALAGFGVLAGQPGLNALAATWYPATLRSTGLGAALGVGRFGAILGPLAASAMLERGLGFEALFRAAAVPASVTLAAVLVLGRVLGRQAPEADGAPAAPARPG
jgi:AAHS family 4-hydroxybenzoate transporter-like MFS transporter